MLVTGCGHSIVRTDRGTGFHLRVPNPFQPGDSFVDLKFGNIDTTMAIIRGNTTFDSNSAKGGSLTGTGGISERFALSTNPQFNEGYVAEVLTSPNAPAEVKIEVARYLVQQKAPAVSNAKAVSIGAASGSGEKSNEINPEKTGIDNIVDKAAETIQETAPVIGKATTDVVENISNNTASVAKHATDVAGETTQKVTSTISNKITLSVIITLIITGILIVILEISRKKKKKPEPEQTIITEEIQENKFENIP
jgi:hypothetical protein